VPVPVLRPEIPRRAKSLTRREAKHYFQLAQGPTVAYRLIKRALRQSFANDLDGQLALEAELQGEAGRSRDFQEGVMAFLEKRPARYEGR
jgi:2-(1,2-epoxy-1,2-dihydrophenyl)acetyl-CoA isomerase